MTPHRTRLSPVAVAVLVTVAVVAAPIGVLASTGVVSIADPAHPAQKAHVSKHGQLGTYLADAKSGVAAKVNKTGRQLVALPAVQTVRLGGGQTILNSGILQATSAKGYANVAPYGSVTVAVNCYDSTAVGPCAAGTLTVSVDSITNPVGQAVVLDQADVQGRYLKTFQDPGQKLAVFLANDNGHSLTVTYAVFARP